MGGAIARQLGMDRKTVRRYIERGWNRPARRHARTLGPRGGSFQERSESATIKKDYRQESA